MGKSVLKRRIRRRLYALASYISPRLNTQLLFRRKFGRKAELDDPKTLNEKLLKLKLERYGTDVLVRRCADKYAVREYVKAQGLRRDFCRLLSRNCRRQEAARKIP